MNVNDLYLFRLSIVFFCFFIYTTQANEREHKMVSRNFAHCQQIGNETANAKKVRIQRIEYTLTIETNAKNQRNVHYYFIYFYFQSGIKYAKENHRFRKTYAGQFTNQ